MLALLVLSHAVSDRFSFEVFLISLSSAGSLWGPRMSTKHSYQSGSGDCSGGRGNGVDYLKLERKRYMVSQLGAHLACLVHGRESTESWPVDQMQLTIQKEESAT